MRGLTNLVCGSHYYCTSHHSSRWGGDEKGRHSGVDADDNQDEEDNEDEDDDIEDGKHYEEEDYEDEDDDETSMH